MAKSSKLPDFDKMQPTPTILEKESMQQNVVPAHTPESPLDIILNGFKALKERMQG